MLPEGLGWPRALRLAHLENLPREEPPKLRSCGRSVKRKAKSPPVLYQTHQTINLEHH